MKLYLVPTVACDTEKTYSLLTGKAFLAYVKNAVADGYYDGAKPANLDEAVNTYNANETEPVNVLYTTTGCAGAVMPGAFAEFSITGNNLKTEIF